MVFLHLSCDIISYGTILAKLEAEQNNHENVIRFKVQRFTVQGFCSDTTQVTNPEP